MNEEVREFEKQNHSQIGKVRARQKKVHTAWEHLNKLKAEKERNLQGNDQLGNIIMLLFVYN